MNSIVTRFAPSPTGYLHIGGVRTALVNYIITKQYKKKFPESKFLLRIEDTDKVRSKRHYKNNIIDGLKWLGINYDNLPFLQSDNIKRHQEIAYILIKRKKAFKCNCSPKLLEEKRLEIRENRIHNKRICTKCEKDEKVQSLKKEFVVRIKIPEQGKTTIDDCIQGQISVENKEIDDFILLRKDGSPTYMLSAVVDDFDMGINLIIRGDDHLNNVFRQNFIYSNMGWKIPKYAHLPLIHGEDGKKLSKRHGAIDINEFKEKGFLKEGIINNLILLGWSPTKCVNEFIEIDEIIDKFNINKISKSSSIFSYNKLNFFNNHYLNKKENIFIFLTYCNNNKILKKYLKNDKEKILRIFSIYKKKIKFYKEFESICYLYCDSNFKTKTIKYDNKDFLKLIIEFKNILEKISIWSIENLEYEIKNFINNKKIKFSDFGKPIRLMLINLENGPSISDIFFILDKKDSINRINEYINDK